MIPETLLLLEFADEPGKEVNRALTCGWQVSPRYVIMGASMKPIPIPRMILAANSMGIVLEKQYSSQPTTKGIFTRIIDHLRPKNSTISPDIRLPIG